MVTVRPVAMSDLDALVGLAGLAGVGLTTLPKDRALLARRIERSVESFRRFAERPGGESYLFVMDDSAAQKVIGACGIVSKVGGFEPFYGYRIESQRFESAAIGVHKEVPILRLIEEHDGPCEIGSLFLHPDFRKSGSGRLLQLVRFLFMAEHPRMFETTVISEIRGTLDAANHSPFWDALGRHFFGLDFAAADRLSVVNKKFIAELMPDHPIYIPLLPADAQAVIGRPHRDSERAVRNLEIEGFRFRGMVDIFDAGPVLTCLRNEIRTVRESRRTTVAAITAEPPGDDAPVHMMGTTTTRFRAVCGAVLPAAEGGGGVRISAASAAALEASVGDPLRIVEMSPPPQLATPKAV